MSKQELNAADYLRTLIEFYKDNVIYQRHHEEMRFKSSQLIISLTAALIALLKFTNGSTTNYASAIFIVLLGLLGIAQVKKHSERADRHAGIARAYRRSISQVSVNHSGQSIEEIHNEAADHHREKAGAIYHWRARSFWLYMHISIIAIGLGIAVLQYMGRLSGA